LSLELGVIPKSGPRQNKVFTLELGDIPKSGPGQSTSAFWNLGSFRNPAQDRIDATNSDFAIDTFLVQL